MRFMGMLGRELREDLERHFREGERPRSKIVGTLFVPLTGLD